MVISTEAAPAARVRIVRVRPKSWALEPVLPRRLPGDGHPLPAKGYNEYRAPPRELYWTREMPVGTIYYGLNWGPHRLVLQVVEVGKVACLNFPDKKIPWCERCLGEVVSMPT